MRTLRVLSVFMICLSCEISACLYCPTIPRPPSVTSLHEMTPHRLFRHWGCQIFDYVVDFHHAEVFMMQNVAMHDEGAGKILVAREHVDRFSCRNQQGIFPYQLWIA